MLQGANTKFRADAAGAVLVVEDDPVCRGFCAEVLSERGFRVHQARNAQEGLALLNREGPRTVICDLNLPDPAAHRQLLATCLHGARHRHPPALILMSADAGPARSRVLPSSVPTIWLDKPFSPEELLAAVSTGLRRHGARVPGESGPPGVREASGNEQCPLAALFRAELTGEIERLDRCIANRRWLDASDALHRLRGAAAMSGHPRLAACCKGLAGMLGSAGPSAGWAERYLGLLRQAESILDGPAGLRPRG